MSLTSPLEDNERRIYKRLLQLFPPSGMPQRLFVWTGCRRLDQGGAEAIRDWVEERALPSHDRRRRVQQDPRGAGRPGAIISCTLTFNAVETITSDVMSWRAAVWNQPRNRGD